MCVGNGKKGKIHMLHYRIKKAFGLFKGAVRWLQQNDIAFTRLLESWKIIKNWNAPLESKNVQDVHVLRKTMIERYNVPGHEPRKKSPLFTKNHRNMVVVENQPCYICGVKNSTLNVNDKNPFRATQMESHHWIEWSLANCLDWDTMQKSYPDFENWKAIDPKDASTYFNFIDDRYNLVTLCNVCHRGVGYGIHCLEKSIWEVRRFIRNDFEFIPFNNAKTMIEFVDDLS